MNPTATTLLECSRCIKCGKRVTDDSLDAELGRVMRPRPMQIQAAFLCAKCDPPIIAAWRSERHEEAA